MPLLTAFILLVVVLVFLGTLAYASLSAAPWVPLFQRDVNRMIELADLKPGETIFDLGAGDGRILLAAARKCDIKAIGFEIATLPFLFAKWRIKFSGLSHRITLRYANFYKIDFRQADVIFCFLTPPAMRKLELKIKAELKPGARFLSYAFSLPNFKPELVDKPEQKVTTIFLYRGE